MVTARLQNMLIPTIEDCVPLPASVAEAMPPLTAQEELAMRARTVKLLSDLTQTPLVPTAADISVAAQVATQMALHPEKPVEFNKYPNETIAYLAGLVQQSNYQLVEEYSELKNYVVNKLVHEIEHAKDSKARIMGLKLLGEVDGVDAFKKRTSVEHTFRTPEEVENKLREVLDGIPYYEIDPKTEENPENGQESAENPELDPVSDPENALNDEIMAKMAELEAQNPENSP